MRTPFVCKPWSWKGLVEAKGEGFALGTPPKMRAAKEDANTEQRALRPGLVSRRNLQKSQRCRGGPLAKQEFRRSEALSL